LGWDVCDYRGAKIVWHHSGEEFIYVLEGGIKVLTEFYDPVVLQVGESIYIDSNMGHVYVTADGCEEAMVLGVCSSTEEKLMESLLSLHGDINVSAAPKLSDRVRPAHKPVTTRKR
jgi:uncharacterized cupin superfamily protein